MEQFIQSFFDTWGYLGVFLFVMIESSGIPFPGEAMLIAASVWAGLGNSDIRWVIFSAALGAIIGDNLGFLAGLKGGYKLLKKIGPKIHLDEKKLDWAQKFYQKHGDKTVFFGRFITILRAWSAFLAGVNQMKWPKFLLFNALGGISWSVLYGTLAFKLASDIPLLHKILKGLGVGSFMVGAIVIIVIIFLWKWRDILEKKSA